MKNRYYLLLVLHGIFGFLVCCYYYEKCNELFSLIFICGCGIINISVCEIWIYRWFNEKMKL